MTPTSTSAEGVDNVVPDQIDDGAIGEAVREILQNSEQPMLLSTVGVVLSNKFSRPLKDILGSRKLRKVIQDQLGERVRLTGPLSQVRLSLRKSSDLEEPSRYDRTFWAAFSKPIAMNANYRAVRIEAPYDFTDLPEGSPIPDGWRRIEREIIPDAAIPKADREIVIKGAILEWCLGNGVEPTSFAANPTSDRPVQPPHAPGGTASSRVATLLHFIETVPESDRHRYSLPLDLVRQFLI